MAKAKRYAFTFTFVFDCSVDSMNLVDLNNINERRLTQQGYEVKRDNPCGNTLVATTTSGQLDIEGLVEMWEKRLLHFKCETVSMVLHRVLIPTTSPQAEGGRKYRDGAWCENFDGMTYECFADEVGYFITVTTQYQPLQDRKRWRDNFIYVTKRLQHVARLTKLATQLFQAQAGSDPGFVDAARGKLMAAIGARIV